MKQVAGSLKIELASYREMLSFSQFGSDLDAATQKILSHGAVLMETLKQKQYAPFPWYRQVVELFAVKNRYLDSLQPKEVNPYLNDLYKFVESRHKDVIDLLIERKKFDDELTGLLTKAIEDFVATRK
jgi:F-type H+-transporting ATPase subunit alpha